MLSEDKVREMRNELKCPVHPNYKGEGKPWSKNPRCECMEIYQYHQCGGEKFGEEGSDI